MSERHPITPKFWISHLLWKWYLISPPPRVSCDMSMTPHLKPAQPHTFDETNACNKSWRRSLLNFDDVSAGGDAFYLDLGAERQRAHLITSARRKWRRQAIETRLVDGVGSAEIRNI